MKAVICKLPKAGLGNQLFPLIKALIFSRINHIPLIITGYHRLKIGPYLRKEKTKRVYRNNFNFQKTILGEWIDILRQKYCEQFTIVVEPPLDPIDLESEQITFSFSAIPHWSNYFDQLRDRRELAISVFMASLTNDIKERVKCLTPPVIGVHIRMGDFRKLKLNENFASVGHVRTPEEYFIDVITSIRRMAKSDLPVSIFTDGFINEFEKLTSLPNLNFIEGNRDIVDLLLLSKSKIIVTAAGSTFSYWAGFLSNAPLINHPDHIHQPIRGGEIANEIYEGPMNEKDELLIKNIQSILTSLAHE